MASCFHGRAPIPGCSVAPPLLAFYLGLLLTSSVPSFASALRGPSSHWVYKLPLTLQTNPITLTVLYRAEDGRSVSGGEIIAYCEPWNYTVHGGTDASGKLEITGPVGDWHFCGRVNSRSGAPVAIQASALRATNSTQVTLRANPQREVRFITSSGSDLLERLRKNGLGRIHEACRPRLLFAPTNLSSQVVQVLCGAWDDTTPYGFLADTGARGLVQLISSPTATQDGYALTAPLPALPTKEIRIDESSLATLEFSLESFPKDLQFHLLVRPSGMPVSEVGIYVPLSAAKSDYRLRFTPGRYCITLNTSQGPFAGRILPLLPRSTAKLHWGGPFSTRLTVLRWDQGYFSAWADVEDKYGNPVQHPIGGKGTFTLRRNGQTFHQSEITRAHGRVIEIVRDWGSDWRNDTYDYDYAVTSPLIGSLSVKGNLVPGQTIVEQLHEVSTSDHIQVLAREKWADGRQVTYLLEQAFRWWSDNYLGPAAPSQGGRYKIWYQSPTDVAWSGGDAIGLDIYSAYWSDPVSDPGLRGVLLHEFGHSYAWPPNALPALGHETGQSAANLLMQSALWGTQGERAYRFWQQSLNARLGATTPVPPDLTFVFGYLEQTYGMWVTRDYYRALFGGKGNCRQIVLRLDFLKTEAEKVGAILSFLTGTNLAWLHRWAGFDVSDELIARALAEMRQAGAVPPPQIITEPAKPAPPKRPQS